MDLDIYSNNKQIFYKAKNSKRILAYFFDIIFISIICLIISFICLVGTDIKQIVSKDYILEGWRLFLISSLVLIIYILYFLIIPLFWKKQTIGRFIYKIKYSNQNINNKIKFHQLLIHDLLIFYCFIILNWIVSIAYFALNSDQTILKWYLSFNNFESINQLLNQIPAILGLCFKIIQILLGVITFVLIIMCCFNKNNQSLCDKLSNLYLIDYKKPYILNKETPNLDLLPGQDIKLINNINLIKNKFIKYKEYSPTNINLNDNEHEKTLIIKVWKEH